MQLSQATKSLGLFLLVMLIVGSIDSVRNLPATALFGSSLVFFFIFSAIIFLIPTGLVSAELSAAWTEQGGIYDWVRLAFGEKIALLAIWLQWINTMVWFPTILSFIAATIAFLIDPALDEHKGYLIAVILVVFWTLTLLNFKGVRASAKFAGLCGLVGMLFPMVVIIVLGMAWMFSGKPLQLTFNWDSMLPRFDQVNSWISLTAIMSAFLGMELATVHVRNVINPQKTFPKALIISVILILFTMIFGSLAIAEILPQDQISLVDGVMRGFQAYLGQYHMPWMVPTLTLLLLIGSLGGMINWIISPAKGLLRAAQHGYFPQFLAKENAQGVPTRMLFLQAVIVSLICLAFLLMPSVNGSYWLLTALSTQLYMIMYVFMFFAALRLRYKYPLQSRPFKISGGLVGMWLITLLGLFGCVVTLVVGFFPPDNIDVGGKIHYEIVFTAGIIAMLLPVIILYLYRQVRGRRWQSFHQ